MQIDWDEWAVPTIVGDDELDVVRGIGYATAQAHATAVLELYGIARGGAAAWWGTAFIADDTMTIQLGLREATDVWMAAQSAQTLERIAAFCDGFNAACTDEPGRGTNRREVLPVTARDVVAHTLRILVRFNQVDYDKLAFAPDAFMRPTGSNGWAIAGHRSTTGNAMVMINPHMSWLPNLAYHRFFEFRTISPGRDFHGVTLLGAPWQSMGYSSRVAWGHTVNPIRNAVVFELGLDENDTYEFDGARRAVATEEHKLEVLGQEPLTVLRRTSVHGPVITAPDGAEVSVRMSGLLHDATATALECWWQLSLAESVEDLLATHDRLPLPMFNLVAGDSSGSIAALFCGTPPVRASWGDASRRLSADDAAALAAGVHPASAMPRTINPPAGWVQNCNEPPWLFTDPPLNPADYPAGIAPDPSQVLDVRCYSSRDWLAAHESVSPEQLQGLKFHKRAYLADLFLDELLDAAAEDGELAPAVEALRAWDRECDADSAGYVLFWMWTALNAPALTTYSMWVAPEVAGEVPSKLSDPRGGVELLRLAAGVLSGLGIPLNASIGQIARFGEGDLAVPADGGSGLVGCLKSLELTPTPGGLPATAGDTWIARVELREDAPPIASHLLVYGNTTETSAPPSEPQWPLWAADRFRPDSGTSS